MFTRFDARLVAPASALAVVLAFAQPGLLARQAAAPTAAEVIARHVKATGGAAAYKAVTSMRGVGKFTMAAQGISGDVEVLGGRPNKNRVKVTVAGLGTIESGFDGKVGWSIEPMNGPQLITGRQLAELTDDAWFDGTLHESDHIKSMTYAGREEFDKKQAHKIKVVMASGTEQDEFFDVDTGLQLGFQATRQTQIGVLPTTGILRDYKPFNGLQLPTTLIQSSMGIEQMITLDKYEFNSVPASAFDLPPAIKALIK